MPVSLVKRTARRTVIRARATTIRTLREFRDRTEGVAAVEFALILPIMALMFIGSVEMSQAVSIDRRSSQVAASTSDLVGRTEGGITEGEMLDIAKIGSWLVKPFDQTKLKVSLSLVSIPLCPGGGTCPTGDPAASDSNIKTRWKCDYDSSNASAINCTCQNTQYTMPAVGLIKYGDAVIISDVEYSYTPLVFNYFMKQAQPSANGVYKLTEKNIVKTRGTVMDLQNNDKTVKCTSLPAN
jgi:Flp pilus assembly protein TadG